MSDSRVGGVGDAGEPVLDLLDQVLIDRQASLVLNVKYGWLTDPRHKELGVGLSDRHWSLNRCTSIFDERKHWLDCEVCWLDYI